MSIHFITENEKFVLLTGEASNPVVIELTRCQHPEELGALYVVARKRTHNPVAVATVNKNGYSIHTKDAKTDVVTDPSVELDLRSILDTFAASRR